MVKREQRDKRLYRAFPHKTSTLISYIVNIVKNEMYACAENLLWATAVSSAYLEEYRSGSELWLLISVTWVPHMTSEQWGLVQARLVQANSLWRGTLRLGSLVARALGTCLFTGTGSWLWWWCTWPSWSCLCLSAKWNSKKSLALYN